MKTTLLIIVANLILTNISAQGCRPIDCVIPFKKGCEDYCKEGHILNSADKREMRDIGLSKESVKAIKEYRERESNVHYKELEEVIGKEERERIFKEHNTDRHTKPERE